MDDRKLKVIYGLSNIPIEYIGKTYEDFMLPSKAAQIRQKIAKAPSKGKLLIIGEPAPIINQLALNRKIYGIDFVKYFESRFKDEDAEEIPQST